MLVFTYAFNTIGLFWCYLVSNCFVTVLVINLLNNSRKHPRSYRVVYCLLALFYQPFFSIFDSMPAIMFLFSILNTNQFGNDVNKF